MLRRFTTAEQVAAEVLKCVVKVICTVRLRSWAIMKKRYKRPKGRPGKRENPSVSSVLSKPKIVAGSADVPGHTIITKELVGLGSGNCGIERNREGTHMDLKTLLDTPHGTGQETQGEHFGGF